MNRKAIAIVMTGAMLTATGCSAEEQSKKEAEEKPSRVLIAYYSWSGNTRQAAENIQKQTNGKLFEIKPATPYPTDYRACVDQAKKEIAEGFKPELKNKPENLDAYDVVFIGSPNWWGTLAPPVTTFLSSYDLTGKTVVPFFTHGGGGMQNCERDIRKLCEKATVLKAATFSGSRVNRLDDEIAAWARERVNGK